MTKLNMNVVSTACTATAYIEIWYKHWEVPCSRNFTCKNAPGHTRHSTISSLLGVASIPAGSNPYTKMVKNVKHSNKIVIKCGDWGFKKSEKERSKCD